MHLHIAPILKDLLTIIFFVGLIILLLKVYRPPKRQSSKRYRFVSTVQKRSSPPTSAISVIVGISVLFLLFKFILPPHILSPHVAHTCTLLLSVLLVGALFLAIGNYLKRNG